MPIIICKRAVKQKMEANMSLIYILVFVALSIVAGFFWGKNTIKRDAIRTASDDAQLDTLHKLRS